MFILDPTTIPVEASVISRKYYCHGANLAMKDIDDGLESSRSPPICRD